MTLAERLKYAREILRNIKQDELARISGVAQQVISHIERGRTKRSRHLFELAKALKIDVHWLITGEGEPLTKSEDLKEEEIVMPVPLIAWIDIGDFLANKLTPEKIKETDLFIKTKKGAIIFSLVVNNTVLTTNAKHLIEIRPGEEIIVNTLIAPSSGCFVIAKVNDSYILRTYIEDGSDRFLEPFNPSYEKIKINKNVEIIGCVATVMRKV